MHDRQTGTRLENVDLAAFASDAVVCVDPLGLSGKPAPDATPIARLIALDGGGCVVIMAEDNARSEQFMGVEREIQLRAKNPYQAKSEGLKMSNTVKNFRQLIVLGTTGS